MTRDTYRPNPSTPMPRRMSGVATGAFPQLRNDWAAAITAASLFSPTALELTVPPERLESLLGYLAGAPSCLKGVEHVSAHSPTAGPLTEAQVGMLAALPQSVATIVLHADHCTEASAARLTSLGSRLAVLNMDRMRTSGQGVRDLDAIFERLPEARFALDVAHSHSNDPTGQLTHELAAAFGDRLAQLHLSTLRGTNEHWPPQPDDLTWLTRSVEVCPPVPRIWKQVPLFQTWPTGLLV